MIMKLSHLKGEKVTNKKYSMMKQTKLLKDHLIFEHWLYSNSLLDYQDEFEKLNIYTLHDIIMNMPILQETDFVKGNVLYCLKALEYNKDQLDSYSTGSSVLTSWIFSGIGLTWWLLVACGK